MTTSRTGERVYFAGDIFFWWQDDGMRGYEAYPLFEELIAVELLSRQSWFQCTSRPANGNSGLTRRWSGRLRRASVGFWSTGSIRALRASSRGGQGWASCTRAGRPCDGKTALGRNRVALVTESGVHGTPYHCHRQTAFDAATRLLPMGRTPMLRGAMGGQGGACAVAEHRMVGVRRTSGEGLVGYRA